MKILFDDEELLEHSVELYVNKHNKLVINSYGDGINIENTLSKAQLRKFIGALLHLQNYVNQKGGK